MKYSLLIVLINFQLTAFGQQASCVLSSATITKNGKTTYELINSYNAKNQLVQKEERFVGLYQVQANYTQTEKYVYDSQSNVIETSTFINGKFKQSVFRKFDNTNKLLEEAIQIAEGGKRTISKSVIGNSLLLISADGVSTKFVSEKNTAGLTAKESTFDEAGRVINVSTFLYNNAGELTKKSVNDVIRNRTTATSFNRNSAGVIVKEVVSVNGIPFRRVENSLNNAGKVIKRSVFNGHNQLDYIIIFTYDQHNNLTDESYLYNDELITKRENTYDEVGNLVQQDNFERGTLISTQTWQYSCR